MYLSTKHKQFSDNAGIISLIVLCMHISLLGLLMSVQTYRSKCCAEIQQVSDLSWINQTNASIEFFSLFAFVIHFVTLYAAQTVYIM